MKHSDDSIYKTNIHTKPHSYIYFTGTYVCKYIENSGRTQKGEKAVTFWWDSRILGEDRD